MAENMQAGRVWRDSKQALRAVPDVRRRQWVKNPAPDGVLYSDRKSMTVAEWKFNAFFQYLCCFSKIAVI
jgi:hypothetical protein